MKPCLLLLALVFAAGCATMAGSGVITKEEDGNGDGKTDAIHFRYANQSHRNYGFIDNDFDGLFEERRSMGKAVLRRPVTPPLTLNQIKQSHPEQP